MKENLLRAVEEFINQRYNIRFNQVKGFFEWSNLITKKQGTCDNLFLNSLKRELNLCEIDVKKQDVKEIIYSDFATPYNPLQEYFTNLRTNYKSSIKDLAKTVITDNQDVFIEYFTKWLVSVVANIFNDENCYNHTCLVLTGKQGAYKTTWLELLIPKHMKQYSFVGKINTNSKDVLSLLSEYWLINIDDQLRQLNKKDENELKNLITAPYVRYRKPYDINISFYPHRASFCASVNNNDFLTDTTGNRRYLPFEVIDIDINKAKDIDIDIVWKQAYDLYLDKSYKHYFEANEVSIHNEKFEVITIEEQLIKEQYINPAKEEHNIKFIQPALILTHLQQYYQTKLNLKKIGEAMHKLGYRKVQRTINEKRSWYYEVHFVHKNLQDTNSLEQAIEEIANKQLTI